MKFSIPLLFFTICFMYLALFTAKAVYLNKTVYGDGVYYYSWLHSPAIDHDVSFQNEYDRLGGKQPPTPLGAVGNVYPIGPAIFWTPFYLPLQMLLGGDGYSFLYQYITGAVSCLYAIAGLIFLYRLLAKYFSEEVSALTIIGIAFGTNLFFYGSLDTVNSHSFSFFVATILLTLIMQKNSLVLIGLCTGVLSLMRTQDAIFLLLSFPIIINSIGEQNRRSAIILQVRNILMLIAGFIVGFLPQLVAWQVVYGTFTRSPYMDSYHYFNFFRPHLVEVLFSTNSGLFFWTPLTALCLLGIFYKGKISGIQKTFFVLLFIVQWFLIASWSFWWQGESYSGRMFISLLPILSIGLGNILSRQYSLTRWTIVSLFSVANAGAIVYFLATH